MYNSSMGSMVMFSSTIIDKIDKRKSMMPVSVCLQSFLDGKKREVYIGTFPFEKGGI